MDVRVFEAADDLDDGIDFADVTQEFVAEAFTLRGAFDQSGDIDEFDGSGNEDGGFGDGTKNFKTFVRVC